MLNPSTNGLRTSTNVGVAAGLAVVTIFVIGAFAPNVIAAAPLGLEAGLTGLFAAVIARISNTPKNPGLF